MWIFKNIILRTTTRIPKYFFPRPYLTVLKGIFSRTVHRFLFGYFTFFVVRD